MSASRPAGTTPVAILEVARGISRSECPLGAPIVPGWHHRVPVANSDPARRIYPVACAPLTRFRQ